MKFLRNPVDRIWLVLLAATLLTWWLGESGTAASAGAWPVLVMFALAFVKGLLIELDFMELRHAPRLWRRLLVGWLAVVLALLVLAWWVGTLRG